ncbi:MAG: sulfatase family protein [Tepidisphaeraceae bacterium]
MAQSPDIILFLTDDHAPWSIGCYGNADADTPNLDRLAMTGVRFANAFTPTPVCSPARACVMTGRTPSQVGIHDWIEEAVPEFANRDWLAGEITLPQRLSQGGYHTALAGKWHLGGSHRTPEGFDRAFGLPGWQGVHNGEYTYHLNGSPLTLSGNKTSLITDYAARFIAETPPDQPLFLNVGYIATHSPYQAARHDPARTALFQHLDFHNLGSYSPHPWRKDEGFSPLAIPTAEQRRDCLIGYYVAVNEIDAGVGRVLTKLAAAGRLENAVIIYVSDHGCSLGQNGFFGKGNSTRPLNMLDVSLRVPLLMAGPRIPRGVTVDRCVDHYDLFQTVLNLAGIQAPAHRNYPGRSVLPILNGEDAGWDDTRYGEYGDLRMIRTPDAKLVRRQPFGPDELFDLRTDPGETRAIYDAAHAGLRIELLRRLESWYADHERPETSGLRVATLPRHNQSSEAWRDGLRERVMPRAR